MTVEAEYECSALLRRGRSCDKFTPSLSYSPYVHRVMSSASRLQLPLHLKHWTIRPSASTCFESRLFRAFQSDIARLIRACAMTLSWAYR